MSDFTLSSFSTVALSDSVGAATYVFTFEAIPTPSTNLMLLEFSDAGNIKSIGEAFAASFITNARCGSLPITLSTKPQNDESQDVLRNYTASVTTPLVATTDPSPPNFIQQLLSITPTTSWSDVENSTFAAVFTSRLPSRLSSPTYPVAPQGPAAFEATKAVLLIPKTDFAVRVSSTSETGVVTAVMTGTTESPSAASYFKTPIIFLITAFQGNITEFVFFADPFQYEIASTNVPTPALYSCQTPPTSGAPIAPPATTPALAPLSPTAPSTTPSGNSTAPTAPTAAPKAGASTPVRSGAYQVASSVVLFSILAAVSALI